MQFDPHLSPYFVANQDKMRVEFEDPYILIHEKKLSNLQSLLPVS
ncbi:UNVERIFIED_ORG: chaperonin GroEL [Rhizobium aethiopicum]